MQIHKNILKKFQKHTPYYLMVKKDNYTIHMVMLVLMEDILVKIFFKVYKEEVDLILMMCGDGVTKVVRYTFLANTMRQSNVTSMQLQLILIIQLYGITKVLHCIILANTMRPYYHTSMQLQLILVMLMPGIVKVIH